MVSHGAFHVAALDNFDHPAAGVKPTRGSSVATNDDLLDRAIKDINDAAVRLGAKVGMSGKETLDLL